MARMDVKKAQDIFKKVFFNGIIVGLIMTGLAYIVSWVKVKPVEILVPTEALRLQIALQEKIPQFGQRTLDFFQNQISLQLDMFAYVMVVVGAVVVAIGALWLGRVLHETFREFKLFRFPKTPAQKIAFQFLMGLIPLGIGISILSGIDIAALGLLLGIYFVPTVLIIGLLINTSFLKVRN